MSKPDTPKGTGGTLATKWSVAEIQRALVLHTRVDAAIPNVSFGFFKNIECDLVQVTEAGYLREFEIKRSWDDFMADFRKVCFHDDVRIMRLTFVLPEAFAGEKLKKWCAEHYKEFKRPFDFLFYLEDDTVCSFPQATWVSVNSHRSALQLPERFRTETYITPEMAGEIHRNDKDAPYRRKLFLEELAKLYRLGVVRLWHRTAAAEEAHAPGTPRELLQEMHDALCRGEGLDADRWRDRIAKALAERPDAQPAGVPGAQPAGVPDGVRGATEDEVAAGTAQWCQVCRNKTCPFAGLDILVHGCNRMVTMG